MRGNFPARRLPRAWGRFRPLRAFLRRGFPSAREFPCPALAARLGPFPAPPRLSARGFPLRGNLPGACRAPGAVSGPSAPFCAAVSLCTGIFPRPALAARLGPFPAPPRLSAPRFPSARDFSRPALAARLGSFPAPPRLSAPRFPSARGFFPPRRLPRAWGRFRPLRAFLRRGFPLHGDFSPPGACRAPGAVSGPSAPFCARFSSAREFARRLPRAWGRLRPLLSTTLRFLSFRETARVSLLKRSCTQHETCGRTNP